MAAFARDESIVVQAAPEIVFDYLSDITRHGEWAGDKLTVKQVGPGRWESLVDIGIKASAVITVESSERPRRFVYVCDDNVSGLYRWTFTLAPAPRGTRLTHRVERLRGPLLVRMIQPWVMWPLAARPSTRRGLQNIGRRFAAVHTPAG